MQTENQKPVIQKGNTIELPPHGHVRYVDHLGSDQRIVEAARVSYQSPSKGDEADKKLLFYLFKNRHTSPFEQCSITFNIKMPIFTMRQFVRHRMFRLNEWSGRYSELADDFYKPEIWRAQSTGGNKQQGDGMATHQSECGEIAQAAYDVSYNAYKALLEGGVCKEQARFTVPVAIYTEIYVNCDIHNLFHFLTLRTNSHAQKEMRDVAHAMREIAEQLFPWCFEAWHRFKVGMVDLESTEELAGRIYEAYCAAVGGKAFNGDPLPDWKTFVTTPDKMKQALGWVDAANAAMRFIAPQ